MDLVQLREQIDQTDQAIIRLFNQRMDLAVQVAAYKKQHGLPIFDPIREKEKMDALKHDAQPDRAEYLEYLFAMLFELSRAEQERVMNPEPNA
jgi:monofunctional chorismate mutase